MRKIILLTGALLLTLQCADAGILSKVFQNDYYNNGYYPYNGVYYNPNYTNRNYYNTHRHYHRNYPPGYYNRNYYYNQQPVIYKSRVRRSLTNSSEKLVSNRVSELNKIEQKIFNQTYEYDNERNRIERLEKKMFGVEQSGTLEERLIVLKSASKSFKAFNPENTYSNNNVYNNYRPPVFTGTMGSNWRNILWGNFKNQFAGMPTGFTPAMDPAYMDYFEAERAMMGNGQNTYQQTNHGYNYSNVNRGAQTGVTILD